MADRNLVESSLSYSPLLRTSFLASLAPHTGDWLMFALPITSCGLRLDVKAVRVAVGLYGLVCIYVFHTNAAVDLRRMHEASTASSVNKLLARHRDIMP